jgi:hypothetical protein
MHLGIRSTNRQTTLFSTVRKPRLNIRRCSTYLETLNCFMCYKARAHMLHLSLLISYHCLEIWGMFYDFPECHESQSESTRNPLMSSYELPSCSANLNTAYGSQGEYT